MMDLLEPSSAPKRRYRHGHKKAGGPSREYLSYLNMVARCCNPKAVNYHRYGGRGIKICERWRADFLNFLNDMGRCPPSLQLERRDNDGDYEPGNCIWATAKAQANNRRSSKLLAFNGRIQTQAQWSEEFGVKQATLSFRLKSGWSIEKSLTTKSRNKT